MSTCWARMIDVTAAIARDGSASQRASQWRRASAIGSMRSGAHDAGNHGGSRLAVLRAHAWTRPRDLARSARPGRRAARRRASTRQRSRTAARGRRCACRTPPCRARGHRAELPRGGAGAGRPGGRAADQPRLRRRRARHVQPGHDRRPQRLDAPRDRPRVPHDRPAVDRGRAARRRAARLPHRPRLVRRDDDRAGRLRRLHPAPDRLPGRGPAPACASSTAT